MLYSVYTYVYRVQTSLPVCEVTYNIYTQLFTTLVCQGVGSRPNNSTIAITLSAVLTQWQQYCAHSSHDDARVIGPNDSINAKPLFSPPMESVLFPLIEWHALHKLVENSVKIEPG